MIMCPTVFSNKLTERASNCQVTQVCREYTILRIGALAFNWFENVTIQALFFDLSKVKSHMYTT